MTSGIKHSVVWLTGVSPAQCDSRGLSASLETSLPPLRWQGGLSTSCPMEWTLQAVPQ